MIKETIVAEGKNDAAAIKRAVDADVITTSGFGLTKETIERIRTVQQRSGIIILTDPDFMGEKIRRIIADKVPGVRHAFIPKEEAMADDDVGVENASPESIRKALSMAKIETQRSTPEFEQADLLYYGLVGQGGSGALRSKIGAALGIGYGNAKQFLHRLNKYGITRKEFETAAEQVILAEAADRDPNE